jgi:spermidine/putrescine transport system ATP-binding protein
LANEPIIQLQNISKAFDGKLVVENFNLSIKKGEFVTFLGPSGCGKTTTLRMIAGFELPTKGKILLNGQDITFLPPYKRPVNTVFQRYALFAHLDVYDNVAFGLRLKKFNVKTIDKDGQITYQHRKYTADEIDDKVLNALQIVDLEDFENRDVATLSGGQQQRVAIARAIVNDPQILLLDEPLGALDLKMRQEMQLELKEMQKKIGITFIYVTHDQEEALTMSDTIVVMKDGLIQQVGSPIDIYNEPVNAFVANFIGESNIYNGISLGPGKVRFLTKQFDCEHQFEKNEKVDVILRPEDITIKSVGKGQVDGKITNRIFKGVHYEYVFMVGKNEVLIHDIRYFDINQEASITIKSEDIHIMKKELITNTYQDAYINDKNQLVITDATFDVDITSLIPGAIVDDKGYLISSKKVKYDLKDLSVKVEIPFTGIELMVNEEEGQISATVIQSIYQGDHYQVIVRTEEEEDYVVDTEYDYEIDTKVGVLVDLSKIKMIPKGNLNDYEV